jgi:APA family basic amino acid/polyamine antiporter
MALTPVEMAARITNEEALTIVLVWIFTGIRDFLPVLVAILAASILLAATNAGLLGISRLTYNMSNQRQLPALLSRVHHHFRTPYLAIILFSIIALALLVPGFFSPALFTDLGGLYVFGSLMTFAIAHASIIALRVKKPGLLRPFKLGMNIKVLGAEWPLTAILGFFGTAAIWVVVVINQPYSRWAGLGWMAIGLIVYFLYHRRRHTTEIPPHSSTVSSPGKSPGQPPAV